MTENAQQQLVRLGARDEAVNIARAIMLGMPYLGPVLERLLFGRLEELRFRRIEATLKEVASAVASGNVAPGVASEQFANLLEATLPGLARSLPEDKRQRFRDLLINAARLDPKAAEWEEAELAGQLLSELAAPALSILAQVWRARMLKDPAVVSRPVSQVVSMDGFDWDSAAPGPFSLGYEWPVVEEWGHRLRERRLLGYQSSDARGGFGGIYLTELGQMLIRWTTCESA